MDVKAPLRRFDAFQQRVPALALPLGIVKKFGEDEGGSMVSLIAYRAFFSLFPLLLLMTTILGYVLAGNDELREEVVNSTLSQFPIIGNQLKGGTLTGSGVALAVGIVGSVLAGLGVVLETEQTFNRCWGVPKAAERGFVGSRLRGIGLLVVLGGLAVVSTVVSGLASGGADFLGAGGKVGGLAIATALNLFVFGAVFRLLTTDTVETRSLDPRHLRRDGRLGDPADRRRLVHLARGEERLRRLRHLRPRDRPARLDPPRRDVRRARRRDECRPHPQAVAAGDVGRPRNGYLSDTTKPSTERGANRWQTS